MRETFNILFTSAGRRVALIRLFRQALDALKLPGKLVAADARGTAPARFVSNAFEEVPAVGSPGYVDRLRDICRKHRIRLVVPLIDPELQLLARHREHFLAEGITPLISSSEVTQLCFDKRLTHNFFRKAGVATPAILDPRAVLSEPKGNYPFFLKPACGSSSDGATRIDNPRQLEFFLESIPAPVLQEFVAGQEYTLDILADFEGRVRCVVPRLRMETRTGEISKGMTVKNRALIDAGKRVVEALPGAMGCITVQCFLTPQGEIQFIEINPRFGGGFPLSAQAGADFPRWIIELMLGRNPQIALDGWTDGLLMLRYDEAVFVPHERVYEDFHS